MKSFFLLDEQSSILNNRERILYFILVIFFFTLYMPAVTWLYNVLMYVIFVYSFFFNCLAEKWTILKSRKGILIVIIFFLLNCLSALISTDKRVGISFVGLRISLFVLPVALGSLYIKNYLKERLILGFAIATFFAALGCVAWAIFKAAEHHDLSLLYNDNLSAIINLQSIYFAMFVNLAIFSFIFLLISKSKLVNSKVIISLVLFLFVVQFLLASRIAIFTLYATMVCVALYYIIQKKMIIRGIGFIISLAVLSVLLVKVFPDTVNRFNELGYTKFDYKSTAKESHFTRPLTADQWNGANTRLAVWNCAWEIIKDQPIFGTRLGDKKEALRKEYVLKDFKEGFNKNTHNNYLDVWMSLGLVGLVLFLTGFFILPLYDTFKYQDWYGSIIIISFMISLFTETYMDRTMGNTALAFFLSFIASYKKPEIDGTDLKK